MKLGEYILKVFSGFGREKQFVFSASVYNGSEEGNQINDTNVVEYEFINLGTTTCVINNTILLYPVVSGKQFHRIKMCVSFNEMDVTVYSYRFEQPDFFIFNNLLDTSPSPGPDVFMPREQAPGAPPLAYTNHIYNRLLVISKVKAYKRNNKAS